MEGLHTVLSPDTDANAQTFLCMITVDSESGRTIIRKYSHG
jgi:hypothetical protein